MMCSIIKKIAVSSPADYSPRKTCKTRGIDTSESSFAACIGVY